MRAFPEVLEAANSYGSSFSKASEALRRMRADIVAGALKPDQKLSFKYLVSRYGVGTSPLREALCQLAGQGLVDLESQRGFRLAPVSKADLMDVISLRRLPKYTPWGSRSNMAHSSLCKRCVRKSDTLKAAML